LPARSTFDFHPRSAAYDRDTFYTFEAKGYIDYPFYNSAVDAGDLVAARV